MRNAVSCVAGDAFLRRAAFSFVAQFAFYKMLIADCQLVMVAHSKRRFSV